MIQGTPVKGNTRGDERRHIEDGLPAFFQTRTYHLNVRDASGLFHDATCCKTQTPQLIVK